MTRHSLSPSLLKSFAGALGAFAVVSVVVSLGCEQQSEGDRCNPNLAAGENDCNGGLKCQQPPLCPENYCCPVAADGGLGASDNGFCRTGCSGGAASICNAQPDAGAACDFACKNDPGDLTSTAVCNVSADGGEDGATEASPEGSAAHDGGVGDASGG